MVQFIPAKDDWAKAFREIGSGVSQGYMQRSDEKAVRKAIEDLGPNPAAKDIVSALTKTHTYGNEAKKNALSNFAELGKAEETQRHNKKAEEIAAEKNEIAAGKIEAGKNESKAIIENSNLPEAQKKNYIEAANKGEFSPASARSVTTKAGTEPSTYDIAKNQAERHKPTAEHYQKKAIESEQALPLIETAIVNNEAYSTPAKFWDTAIDTINSPFLNQFKSKTGQQLEAIVPVSVASFGSKMSGQLTNQKINLITKKAVGLGKDKNANRLMLYLDYYDRKLDQIKAQVSNEIITKNKYGLPPADFDEQVKAEMKPYQKMISSDINQLLADKEPTSPMSNLSLAGDLNNELQEGEIAVISPNGEIGALPEEALNTPEFKNYKRLRTR